MDGSDPIQNYHAIREELRRYNDRLMQRPEVVVVSKCELPGADEVRDSLAAALSGNVLLVSAVTGQNLNQLIAAVVRLLDDKHD
jgi:GTP-binding protein